jgi:hypothetical protein
MGHGRCIGFPRSCVEERRRGRGAACLSGDRPTAHSERVDHRRCGRTRSRPRDRRHCRTRSGPGEVACSKAQSSPPSSAVHNHPRVPARALADAHGGHDGSRAEARGGRYALEPPRAEAVATSPSTPPCSAPPSARGPLHADRRPARCHRCDALARIGRAPAGRGRALPGGAGGRVAVPATQRPASPARSVSRLWLRTAGPPAGT